MYVFVPPHRTVRANFPHTALQRILTSVVQVHTDSHISWDVAADIL
jgi:hypothetical protein